MKSLLLLTDPPFSLVPLFAFCGVFVILLIVCQWVIYRKAGYEGWESIIPIYNTIILLRIVGKPWWWLLLMLIPGLNIIWSIWMTNMLSKSFGKDEGFTVGLIFLSFIFYPILAFGKAEYQGPFGNKAEYERFRESRRPFDFESGGHQQ